MKPPHHIASLDGVRGIAILMVVCCHLQYGGMTTGTSQIAEWVQVAMWLGWTGVDLFFVLSGFLITGILLDKKGTSGREWDFYKRRLLRIAPLYYAVLLAGYFIAPHIAHYRPQIPSLKGWLSYLLYYQNWWIPTHEPKSDLFGHFWSLAVEEQFYLVWPWFVWNLKNRSILIVCSGGMVLALAMRFAFYGTAYPLFTSTLTRMDGLLMGAICAVLYRSPAMLRAVKPLLPVIGFVFGSGLLITLNVKNETVLRGPFTLTLGITCLAVTYAALVLWAASNDHSASWSSAILRFAPLRSFGRYAYGLYVYHPYLLFAGALLLPWRGLLPCVGFILVFYLCAAASYELFEKRLLARPSKLPAITQVPVTQSVA